MYVEIDVVLSYIVFEKPSKRKKNYNTNWSLEKILGISVHKILFNRRPDF